MIGKFIAFTFSLSFNIRFTSLAKLDLQNWHVGRIPPSQFEYADLNGYFTSINAKDICENDFQCGGFTFKGTKEHQDRREIYFFHFVRDDEKSLKEYMEYPHWTTFIVRSRNHVMIPGHYSEGIKPFVNLRLG